MNISIILALSTLVVINIPNDPKEGYSIEMKESSFAEFEYPNGSYWKSAPKKAPVA